MTEPNEAQREAIHSPLDKPLKVVAGAGTGKTTVLALRYLECLRQAGIRPSQVLALTFSNKAAAEMRHRIVKQACYEGLASEEDFLEAFIGTFHSFAGRLLKKHSIAAGLDPGMEVTEEPGARLTWLRVVEDYLGPGTQGRPPGLPYERLGFFRKELFGFVQRLKDSAIGPRAFLGAARAGLDHLPEHIRRHTALTGLRREGLLERAAREAVYEEAMAEAIFQIYQAYQEALRKRGLMDFGDLLLYAKNLLENNGDLRSRLQQAYRHILVDEFQDTNEAQFRLLELLAAPGMANVSVVGDEKQAIYGWRNARVENVEDFAARDWCGREVTLDINYRSYRQILEVAHTSIIREGRFCQSVPPKLQACKGESPGPCVVLAHAPGALPEAAFVARTIQSEHDGGSQYKDMAILMRSMKRSAPYEDALRRLGIPYRAVGGSGFYDRQEIRDILAFIRVAHNPYDNLALVRVMQRPPFSIGDGIMQAIASSEASRVPDDRHGLYLYDALKESGLPEAARVLTFLDWLMAHRSRMPLREFLLRAVEESGYARHLYSMALDDSRRALGNLTKLFNMASSFERAGSMRGLGEFVHYVMFSLDDSVAEPEAPPPGLDVVTLMTVHQAKGLEFPLVFVVDAAKDHFPLKPHYGPLHFQPGIGLLVRKDIQGEETLKFNPKGIPGWWSRREVCERDFWDEERRVWYVALTRAKDRLWITSSGEAGRFFEELRESLPTGEMVGIEGIEVEATPMVEGAKASVESPPQAREVLAGVATTLPESSPVSQRLVKTRLSLSFSALRTYLTCPRRYRALYQWGLEPLPPPGEGGVDASLLGRLVHRAIVWYHLRGKPRDTSTLLEEAAHCEGLYPGEEYERLYRERALALFQGYLGTELAQDTPDPQDLERELRWRLEAGGTVVEFAGVVDRIRRGTGAAPAIIDYKTGSVREEMDIYGHQVRLYRMAAASVDPTLEGARMFLLELPGGSLWEVPEGDADTLAILGDVARRIRENDDEEVIPGDREACHYCEIAGWCLPQE
jgi:DNA helicase-2/ATP-dependent DNA helicase PcrA